MEFLLFLTLLIISGFILSIFENIIQIIKVRRLLNFNNGLIPFNLLFGFLFSLNYIFSLINYTNNFYINMTIVSILNIITFAIVYLFYVYINKKIFFIRKSIQKTYKSLQIWIIWLNFIILTLIFNYLLSSYFINYFTYLANLNIYIFSLVSTFLSIIIIIDFIIDISFKIRNRKVFKNNKILAYLPLLFRYLGNNKYFYKFNIKLNNEIISNFIKSDFYIYKLRQEDYYYFIKHK